ncbi:cysteine desulfurase [Stieleria sp. JC731]|uniref:cysteine desulfurase family protein n=1 Tax=Pirellulaceae TaxID=2691357 RepID=UPI001E59B324|nr:cysteine desulfurase family protein [Stieleria sp. JC731]MCC9602688.1 cysteine desulfurase [Stieleria sp. JC731]
MTNEIDLPIYLDHAATTPIDPRVLLEMQPFLADRFGNPGSRDHRFGWDANDAIEKARFQIANSINASPNEIVFTNSATEAINLALKGIAFANRKQQQRIVTSPLEHAAALQTCRQLQRHGAIDVDQVPVDTYGNIDLDWLNETAKRPSVFAIALMHANNEIGNLNPMEAITEIGIRNEALVFCDATQSFGKVAIDVRDMQVDLMAFSSHKIYGPKGAGALFIRGGIARIPLEPLVVGGRQERGLLAGTQNVPAIVGFGKACELAAEEMQQHQTELQRFQTQFEDRLRSLASDVSINGNVAYRLPSISNVQFPGVDAGELIRQMPSIAVSRRSACATKESSDNHVLRAMGQSPEASRSAIRFSFGKQFPEYRQQKTSAQEIAAIVAAAYLKLVANV